MKDQEETEKKATKNRSENEIEAEIWHVKSQLQLYLIGRYAQYVRQTDKRKRTIRN
jgi:hypothetical protein